MEAIPRSENKTSLETPAQVQAKPIRKDRQPLPPRTLLKRVNTKKKNGKDVVVGKTKLDLFLEAYVENNGNGTEAALAVFDVKNRNTAAVMAAEYLKKAQAANRLLLEKKGYTQGRMIDVAISKMQAAKTPEWWDRLMKMGGYEDFLSKGPVTKQTVNIMQVQKDLIDEYVEGDYVQDPVVE